MMEKIRLPRITFWRVVLGVSIILGIYFSIVRFYKGLGAVTNLSDEFPWGLWIGFDLLCGIALAAGGFTIAATVYIFHLERYRPILRSTILTAFLGYLLFCIALFYDLGRYYNIWRPTIFWNHHSVMFEVAWCVMLYTTVLALEFAPTFLEGIKKQLSWLPQIVVKGIDFVMELLHKFIIPLVIIGVILSTLHQSSLGSLFLIVPTKLHPLWYSGLLPVFFFISAVATGLAMTVVESYMSSRFLGRGIEYELLQGLAKADVVVLGIYLVLKFSDLAVRGNLPFVFTNSYESTLFKMEILIGVIIPMVLFSIPSVRENKKGLFISSFLVVIGTILNRMNVAITGMQRSSGVDYFPAFSEIMISVFIVSIGFLLFWAAAKYLPVFPEEAEEREVA